MIRGPTHADGTLDTAFTTSMNDGDRVSAIALQADGKVIIGGRFGSYG